MRMKSATDNVPPLVLSTHPLLPPSPITFTPNNTNHTFSLYDADIIMAMELESLSPLPEGVELSELSITGANSGECI